MADTWTSAVWIDFNGRSRQTIVKTTGGLAPVIPSLQAASLAALAQFWESPLVMSTATSTPGTYQTVGDTARLLFQTTAGTIVRITLPAPNLSIFMADGITVDPTNPLVAAIIAAVIANCTDGSGHACVAYVGGNYDRSKGTDLLTP